MNFFYMKKKWCFVLELLRFLCFCETRIFQNLWRHHKHCHIMEVTLLLISFESYALSKWNLVKYLCCMTNISNMVLAECWRLETSSRLFYDFIKMTIQQDLAIFNGWHLPFLILLYSPFQKNKTLESWRIWLLSNWDRLLN